MGIANRTLLFISGLALCSNAALQAQLTQACIHIDLGDDEFLSGIALDGNGGFVLVGTLQEDGVHPSAEIAWISTDGILTHGLRSIHDIDGDGFHAVVHTADGGFVAAGRSGTVDVIRLLLAKFNSADELLWSRGVGEQILSSSIALAVDEADDGTLLVAGFRTDAAAVHRPFVLKFDAQGTLLWKSMYEFLSTIDGQATAIAALPDGGCVVTGYQYDDLFTVAHAWVMRLDNTGQVTWSRTTLPGARFDTLVASNDGGYVLSGSVEAPFVVAGDYDVCMAKIDANGQLIWDVIVGADDIEFASAITRTADDGFVAGGATYTDGVAPKAYLVKVNGTGELLWTRKIGSAGSNYECIGVQPTMNGGLALGVRSWDGSERDLGLVLTDELGMPCPACGVDSGGTASQGITFEDHAVTLIPIADTIPRDLLFAESGTSSIICDGVGLVDNTMGKGAITIAPQPMTTSALVTLPKEWSPREGMLFIARDALGRVVRRIPIASSIFILERGDLSPGLFFYEVTHGNVRIVAGQLEVQ